MPSMSRHERYTTSLMIRSELRAPAIGADTQPCRDPACGTGSEGFLYLIPYPGLPLQSGWLAGMADRDGVSLGAPAVHAGNQRRRHRLKVIHDPSIRHRGMSGRYAAMSSAACPDERT